MWFFFFNIASGSGWPDALARPVRQTRGIHPYAQHTVTVTVTITAGNHNNSGVPVAVVRPLFCLSGGHGAAAC